MRHLLLFSLLAACSTKAVTNEGEVDTGSEVTDTGDETGDTSAGDTVDTGDTGEVEETGDTEETADTGDTTETGETGDTTDTTDTEETDTGEWSGDIGEFDGDYTGTFTVTAGAFGLTDTCSGTSEFTVTDGVLTGTASCAFTAGGLAYTLGLTDTYPGDIEGTAVSDTDVYGTITVELADGFSTDWTGAFSGGSLNAEFSGAVSYGGYDLTYEGTFDGTPL